jgi:hypothetical protein
MSTTEDQPNPPPSLEDQLGTETVEQMKDRMHHQPCIECDDMHTAWNCPKTKGPIVLGAWITRPENIAQDKVRRARTLIRGWQVEAEENYGNGRKGGEDGVLGDLDM